ncbi:MAG: helix-turn-helix transcriptional regulator [Verrucomicrobia bacterium]|nr:helix-turn-helix transcriptional regulator [Verrucomicrobiota bacterium]
MAGKASSTSKIPSRKPAAPANVVGAHLRRIRSAQGLTQEQLAARCQVQGLNLTRSTLAKIEAQVRLLKACELFIIAKILKVPMEHFYPDDYGRPAPNEIM